MATAKSIIRQAQPDFTFRAKTALLREGLTITGLAREIGYARNTVSIAINHPSMLPGVRVAICARLGLSA